MSAAPGTDVTVGEVWGRTVAVWECATGGNFSLQVAVSGTSATDPPSCLGRIDTELVELQVHLATGYVRERQRAAELLTQAAFGGARWRPALDSLRQRTSDAAPTSGNAGRLKRLLTVT